MKINIFREGGCADAIRMAAVCARLLFRARMGCVLLEARGFFVVVKMRRERDGSMYVENFAV